MSISRRDLLRRAGLTGAAAAGASVLGPAARPLAHADEGLAPFLHGVASGDPLADRVILWTRVTTSTPAPVMVRWLVATDVAMTRVVASGTTTASAARDFTVKVDATGLAPHTYYFYAFEALGRRSLVGRTKTAPAAGMAVDHVRHAVVSCSSYQHGYFNVYARIAERNDLDAVIHTGDYLYEYAPGVYGDVRDHEPPTEHVTLADYRTRHGQYKLDPDLRRLHQLYPFVVTWDDHESCDNSFTDGANNHQPETEGDWYERKAISQQVYDEWMPIRSTGDPNIIYRALDWGDLVELIVLDTRLEGRDEQLKYPAGLSGPISGEEALGALALFADDPEHRMISEEQLAFLLERLKNSTATWKVINQQVIISGWNAGGLPRLPGPAADAPQFLRDGGNALNPDSWDGYNFQRNQILDFLRDEGIDNVVVLTGDVHSSWAFDMTPDPFNPVTDYNPLTGAGAVGVEFVVPGVTSPPLGDTFQGDPAASVIEQLFLAGNPQMKMTNVRNNGYVILDITPAGAQADWYFVDTVTEVSDTESWFEGWRVQEAANHLVAASGEAPAGQGDAARPSTEPAPRGQAANPSPAGNPLPATGGGAALLGAMAIAGAAGIRSRQRSAPTGSAEGDAADQNHGRDDDRDDHHA